MKEKLLFIAISALLLVPSSLLSQPDIQHPGNIQGNGQHDGMMLANIDNSQIAAVSTSVNKRTESNIAMVTTALPSVAMEDISAASSVDKNSTEDKAIRYSDEELAQLRKLFLQAENHLKLKQDTEYLKLAEQLKDYPLFPYLQYQWLKRNLKYERQVKYYLEHHASSRYAPILKRKWLHHLGKKKQWPLFLENYSATSDTSLNCYYHYAQLQTGDTRAGLEGAKKLWVVGKSQPKECDPLFKELKDAKQLTQDLLWQRFDLALQNNKVSLAAYIKKLMPKKYHARAILWINLHNRPARYLPRMLDKEDTAQSSQMFSHAINRLASKDITKAVELWDKNHARFDIEDRRQAKLEKKLALNLVFDGEAGGYERLSQLQTQDNSSREWRVRAALTEQNWPNVITAIKALKTAEKKQDRWQYWLARALLQTGQHEKAHALLSELAQSRSYYGYMAADRVNSLYQLSADPIDISIEDIEALKNRKAFRVAFEFMVLDKKNDAKMQWWHAVRKLNNQDMLAAAKLAQKWQWDEIAIFTVAKAKHWDDIELRFPLRYAENIHENSARQNLNPAIVFGLVRRESAFNEKAYSSAGARGLMQIMPGTGRKIARNLKERWRGSNSLYNPVVNIRYGAYYYNKLLNQFDGHYALALAAYNAGPNRVKQWLPEDKAMPADIWIETIPYKETREYVGSVLAYALIYQQRALNDEQAADKAGMLSMNDFTQDIKPAQAF